MARATRLWRPSPDHLCPGFIRTVEPLHNKSIHTANCRSFGFCTQLSIPEPTPLFIALILFDHMYRILGTAKLDQPSGVFDRICVLFYAAKHRFFISTDEHAGRLHHYDSMAASTQ